MSRAAPPKGSADRKDDTNRPRKTKTAAESVNDCARVRNGKLKMQPSQSLPGQLLGFIPVQSQLTGNFDEWLAARLDYLHNEHARLGGGAIGAHYLRCLGIQYSKFLFTGDSQDRFRTWHAIRVVSQWLGQLERGLSS